MKISFYIAILYDALYDTLNDDDFCPVPYATTKTPSTSCLNLLQYANQQPLIFSLFADQIYTSLTSIVTEALNIVKDRQHYLVVSFKNLLSSTNYSLFWQKLSEAAYTSNSPILNYHLTQKMYHTLIKTQAVLKKGKEKTKITDDEQAAIVYVGGYIVRKVIKTVSERNKSNKNNCLYLLFQLLEDPETCSEETPDIFNIGNWSKLIDRGGLYHCQAELIETLLAVEKLTKEMITSRLTERRIPILELKTSILNSNDVTESWNNAFSDEKHSNSVDQAMLLEMILSEYLTLRGFAFTAHYMEKYKYNNNKRVLKTKSLGSKLQAGEE